MVFFISDSKIKYAMPSNRSAHVKIVKLQTRIMCLKINSVILMQLCTMPDVAPLWRLPRLKSGFSKALAGLGARAAS
jgi:hypothetical protein